MRRTVTYPPFGSSESEASPSRFNVVIVYEDFETGKHAKKTYDYLVENLGPDCQFTNQMWKLDVLAVPKLREYAVKDASTADIILVSSHGNAVTPALRAWAESWLASGSVPLALVALFDLAEVSTLNPMRDYLEDIARRAGIDFFAQPNEWPKLEPLGAMSQKTRVPLASRAPSIWAEPVQRNVMYAHWGINE